MMNFTVSSTSPQTAPQLGPNRCPISDIDRNEKVILRVSLRGMENQLVTTFTAQSMAMITRFLVLENSLNDSLNIFSLPFVSVIQCYIREYVTVGHFTVPQETSFRPMINLPLSPALNAL